VSRRGGEAGRDKDGVAGFMGSEGIRRGWGGADEMRCDAMRCDGVRYDRNRTLTLIDTEDDIRSWRNFLIYFSHSTTMPYPPRG
jgi:hypothetical protein